MKQELLGLIEKKDLIRALAREDSGNGLIPISFKIYDVPEFVEWKEKIRAELVNIPNQNDTVAQAIDVIDRSFNGWHDEQSFDLLCGKLLAIKSSIDTYYNGGVYSMPANANNTVFIVHGHDTSRRNEVELFMRRIGLEPIILCNQPNGGLTIIEKIEENSDVAFALVLYTGCDEGRLKGTTDLKLRARQNVVFEHGFLINKLGRKRVVALVDDGVETPGDLSGVVYIHFSDTDWKNQVMREINSCGIPINPFNV